MYKKVSILIALFIILSVLTTACGGAEAETEEPVAEEPAAEEPVAEEPAAEEPTAEEPRTLVVAAFGGTWEEAMREAVIKPFQEAYPHVEVVVTLPGNSGAIIAQLRAEKDNPTIDVAIFGGGLDTTAVNEGLIAPLNYDNIPNIADVYDVAMSSVPGYGPSVSFSGVKLAYNTNLVDPAPTSWETLWDPNYKGQVGIYNADNNGGLMLLWLMSHLNGGDMDNMDPGFEKMVTLNENDAIFTTSSSEMQEMFVQETIVAGIIFDGRASALMKDGFPIGMVCPEEGCFVTLSHINVVAGSPNQDLGEAFINQYLSPESQQIFSDIAGYGPANRTAVLGETTAGLVIYGEDQVANLISLVWDDINLYRDEWVERWNREVLAQE